MKSSLWDIMLKEHEKIKMLLGKFETDIQNESKNYKEDFNVFKWQLEKHFFIEEKAIFSFIEDKDTPNLNTLLEDHNEILTLIGEIEDEPISKIKTLVPKLKKIILAHAEFEDDVFYPELDEILSEDQKQEILKRANQVVR